MRETEPGKEAGVEEMKRESGDQPIFRKIAPLHEALAVFAHLRAWMKPV